MISKYQVYRAFNTIHASNNQIIYFIGENSDGHMHYTVESWLKDIGYNWPMPEEQEVEFKLRYLL